VAIALLLAQAALIVHALSHARHGPDETASPGHHQQFCPDCAAFAGLQAGPGAAALLPLLLDPTVEAPIPTERSSAATFPAPRAYRSRAPPG
jgi:hypothetical protein